MRADNRTRSDAPSGRPTKDEEYVQSVFDLTPEDVERKKTMRPKLLGIVCSRSECGNELHCFDSASSKLKFPPGSCQACGVDLIDWDAIRVRNLRDVEVKFGYFQKEWIRHFFFHVPITPRIEKYARHHGLNGLLNKLDAQLKQGKMLSYMPALDWRQTKMLDGTIVHWARHATASCCRACMSYWHNIPLDRELTIGDIEYFKELAKRFIESRISNL